MRILSADFFNLYKLSMFFFVYISFPSPEKEEEPQIIITHDTHLGDKCSKVHNS